MAVFTIAVWLLCGLVEQQWWIQLVCFSASAYLMVEMSNSNALLRVRSRMVPAVFLALSCTGCFLFGSLRGCLVQLCFVASFIILFHTYQDNESPGRTYYSFLCVGLASLVFPQTIFFVPLIWLLMATQLQSLSLRTWLASIIGIFTPYWLLLPYWLLRQDLSWLSAHVDSLTTFAIPADALPAGVPVKLVAVFSFTVLLFLMGVIHIWHRSFEDKIRIRLLYGFFTSMSLAIILFVILQPQHYFVLMPLLFVCASPIIAHFLTLTQTRLTNLVFIICTIVALLLIGLNFAGPLLGI